MMIYLKGSMLCANRQCIMLQEGQIHATFPDPAFASSAAALGGDVIVAPMDGAIQEVLVQPGDEVEADQPVLVMYAMKMQVQVCYDLQS